ncbi:MAG: 50S ribosomal protein L11 [Thaumarchaeota archaeon]|nr:50S ribosomal protein L11 [Nitrososphaerota archaeon]
MGEKKTVSALVMGGSANAGPPLGPALGPLGVNVMQIVSSINEKTKDYGGMRVPVKILVDTETKQFDVEVGVPTTAALVVKEASLQKGSGKPNAEFVGNLSMEQVAKIAKMRADSSYGRNTRSVALEIIGACVSMGVKVEDKDPRAMVSEVKKGTWDKVLLPKA